jgi:ActR/RegA family two-component response regulator
VAGNITLLDRAPPRPVLIMESNPVALQLLKRPIEIAGLTVCAETDVNQAIVVLQKTTPLAAILDLSMPFGAALRIIERVRSLSPETKIYVLSTDAVLQRAGALVGVDAVLRGTEELTRALHRLIMDARS